METATDPRTPDARRSGIRIVSGAFVALALIGLAACGAKENPRPPVKDINEYVALGDSYTAVAGDGPFTDAACLRTRLDYPSLLAEKLSISDFDNASCAGATSANLRETQVPQNGRGSNPPQLDAVSKGTKLVTLGIGLNDYGVSYYLLYACLPVNGKTTPTCQQYLNQPDTDSAKVIANMGKLVKGDLGEVRKAAPNARIVLVGYPRLLPDSGTCSDQLPLPETALERIRTTLRDFNDALDGVAKKAHVDYIDMYAASKGHDICSDDPWTNGQSNIKGKALAFHPYAAYHVAVADRIAALLDKQ